MRTFLSSITILSILASSSLPAFAAAPMTRRDGYLEMWNSLRRPLGTVTRKTYDDVELTDRGGTEITYGVDRGLLPEEETFRPGDPLTLEDALLWLFRTRSVEVWGKKLNEVSKDDLSGLLARYPIAQTEGSGTGAALVNGASTVTEEKLLDVMRSLDQDLRDEQHEISLYGENFHGQGTAFGETFDMEAMTAAHRTYPANTLVKVTNLDNGKSVTVRINDRGPYVKGRDMDLSLAAFLQLAPRSAGVLRHVTFQRMGDANLVGVCAAEPRYQTRITKNVRLLPGIPQVLKLGESLIIHGSQSFVVRNVTYPDGNVSDVQDWILAGDEYRFVPSVVGDYVFKVATKTGRSREMEMRVVQCDAQGN